MNEIDVYKNTLGKQASRIANISLDLDLALTQIEMLNEELKTLKDGEKGGE